MNKTKRIHNENWENMKSGKVLERWQYKNSATEGPLIFVFPVALGPSNIFPCYRAYRDHGKRSNVPQQQQLRKKIEPVLQEPLALNSHEIFVVYLEGTFSRGIFPWVGRAFPKLVYAPFPASFPLLSRQPRSYERKTPNRQNAQRSDKNLTSWVAAGKQAGCGPAIRLAS
jgi:hypothetical protein